MAQETRKRNGHREVGEGRGAMVESVMSIVMSLSFRVLGISHPPLPSTGATSRETHRTDGEKVLFYVLFVSFVPLRLARP